jgi:PKD repeat protein
MQTNYLLRRLLFCCLLMLGTAAITSARSGINGPPRSCPGSTLTYYVTPTESGGNPLSYTWSITPATAGTIVSTINNVINIQWHTPGTAVLSASSGGFAFSVNVTVGAMPDPVLTSDVLLACQPLSNDPKEEQVPPRFGETECQWVCENSTVNYTATGNTGSTYTWTVNGTNTFTPSGNTCSVTWGAAGDGLVTVTETTSSGCTASKSFCVKIIQGPTAKFHAPFDMGDPLTVCKGGELVLNDNSQGTVESPIVSWHWDFGDGQVSNQSPGAANNPIVHQYNDPGGYTLTLTVTNSCGCTATMSRDVRVHEIEAPVITCPRVMCEGEKETYYVDHRCDWQSWGVDGGTILNVTAESVTVTWDHVDPATGFGYVSYKSCGDCSMIVAEPVPVVVNHAEIHGLTNICEGEEYVYRLPKWPTTEMNWSVDPSGASAILLHTDQRNEIVVVPTGTGTVTLRCHYTNTLLSCSGDAELSIQVNPKAAITGSQLVCKGQSANYSIGGYSGYWTLFDPAGNFVNSMTAAVYPATFTLPGVYKLTVAGNTFCPVAEYLITVKDLPAAPTSIMGPDGACAGIPVKYTANPVIAGTTFQWSVTGGGAVNALTGNESYITFAGAPDYTVSVKRVTTDAAQCESSAFTKIVTDPIPVLQINGEQTVCHSSTNTYSVNYSGADAYEWSISPASLGSVVNPAAGSGANTTGNIVSILWNVPAGSGQTATLTVKVKKCNTTRIISVPVFVRGVPVFTAKLISGLPDTTVCSGTPINLQLVPSYAVNSVASVTWDWGDGSTQVINGPAFAGQYAHIYNTTVANQVSFQPVVKIKDPNGCLGNVTTLGPVINVKPTPVAYISPEGPIAQCGAFTQQLAATITTGPSGSNTFTWSPNGATGPIINTSSLGFYSVVVSNSNGCSSTSNIVEIKEGCPKEPCGPGVSPAITLTGTNNCGSINVQAAVSGPVLDYMWLYPATTTLVGTPTATTLNASFTQAGNYQFNYLAFYRNFAGDTCAVDSSVTVLVPYMPELRYQIACNQTGGNYLVTLSDHSSVYPGINPAYTYYDASWTYLGTGSSVTVPASGDLAHKFYLVVQAPGLPACTTSIRVNLPRFPEADFDLLTSADGCVGNAFNFWNISQGINLSYVWNYGTAQSQSMNGGVVYSAPYNGPVTLTITDQYGCTSSKSETINAHANPYTGYVTAAPNPACVGTAVNLSYVSTSGMPAPFTYAWYQGNTLLNTTALPVTNFSVANPGGYWVKATGIYGCAVNTATVPVEVTQIPLAVISGNSKQCSNVPFTLTTEQVPGATYTWAFGGVTVNTATPVLPQSISTPAAYSYTVTVNLNGCSRTSTPFIVTVNGQPNPPAASFDYLGCQPYEVLLTSSGPAGTYNWSNGGYGYTDTTYQGGTYQLTYTDPNGCKNTSIVNVPKDPNEYLWIFPSGCFCNLRLGKSYMIGPIIPFSPWQWQEDGAGVISGSSVMPPYYPTPGHSYNMYLNNGYCEVTSEPMYYNNEKCEVIEGKSSATPVTTSLSRLNSGMQLVPNPARETTTVVYSFTQDSRGRYIEVYDMIGRKLQTTAITKDRGELVLPMAKYSAGMYQVIMKENGVVVQQSKLSLTR